MEEKKERVEEEKEDEEDGDKDQIRHTMAEQGEISPRNDFFLFLLLFPSSFFYSISAPFFSPHFHVIVVPARSRTNNIPVRII